MIKGFIFALGLVGLCQAESTDWLSSPVKRFEEQRLSQLHAVQSVSEISEFSTDGCSGFQSQSWKFLAEQFPEFKQHFGSQPPWEACCIEHDKIYWFGKTHNGYQLRQQADLALKQCVVETGQKLSGELAQKYDIEAESVEKAFSATAEVMYRAVRLGGGPCSMLPWRWGYGWPPCAFATANKSSSDNFEASNIKGDESVLFFQTSAWFDSTSDEWKVPIHAWIYEPEDSNVRSELVESIIESKFELEVTEANQTLFNQRVNWLLSDNERGKRLVVRMVGREFELSESDEHGHSLTVISLPNELALAFADNSRITFQVILPANDSRQFSGEVILVPQHGLSIISDIDDTVKLTNVTDRKALIESTFLKSFKAVSGMAELYQKLQQQGVYFHFVSSSPWQLYSPLNELMTRHGFPQATFHLKTVRFRDETLLNLFKKGTETKPLQIEPLLQKYPDHKFILVGDSGEQDPEVYGEIARKYPTKIQAIWIRNVSPDVEQAKRFEKAFQSLPKSIWQVFERPDEIKIP